MSQTSPSPSVGSGTAQYLRSLRPELPRSVWTVLLGVTISAVGNGFVLPFGSIYLHQVRGLPIPVVGAVISSAAVASLLAGTLGGTLVDRVGPRTMMLAGLLLQAAGYTAFAYALSAPEAVGAMLLIGAGLGSFYPAYASLLAALTDRPQRTAAASLQYAATNLGIGLGAVIGGLLVSTSRPQSFTFIFVANAVSFLLFAGLLLRGVPSGRAAGAGRDRVGYRLVLRDLTFLAVVGFNGLVVLSTYAQLDSSVPLYAHLFLGVPTVALGGILAVNTAFIVVAQLPIARAVRRLDRSRTLALSAGAWMAAWLVGELASLGHGGSAIWLLGLYAVLFGLGECLLSSTIAPLVADLAPAGVRGRYMAVFNLSWSLGLLLGPALGGLVMGTFLRPGMWLLWAAVALCLVLWAETLGGHLPRAVNRAPGAG